MVWGPGYAGAPPPNPAMGQDPFTAAERDTQQMVSAAWWPSAPPQQRQHAIGGRVLVLADGTWWLFGAWARWYRWHPSDGQWYLCPPPMATATRMGAQPAQQAGQSPDLPAHVVPAGPDFSFSPPEPLPFVAHGFQPAVTARVKSTVESAAALPPEEHPHWWAMFAANTPSTVAVTWGVMLWCATAPVFDSRLDEQMLGLWQPYRAKPLPQVDGPRWLTPPPLEALVALYSERLRAGQVNAAVVVLRTMWAVASALREDPRYQARADALLAILGYTLNNPTVDYGALPYGDQALVQQWLTRCPPHLVPALRNESSPGDNFRHAFYDLAQVLARYAGDPGDPTFIEPRLVAAALVAADLAEVRQEVSAKIVPWLDPEIRYTVQAVITQAGHPLRRLWPSDGRLPDTLRTALGSGEGPEKLLAAVYEVDLAWCRLAGIPARPRGFPVPIAVLAEIVGPQRSRAAASAPPITPPPGVSGTSGLPARPAGASPGGAPGSAAPAGQAAPAAPAGPPGQAPGQQPGPAPGAPGAPEQPYVQPPAVPPQPGSEAPPNPAGAGGEEQEENFGVPYTALGFQPGAPGAPGPPGGRPPGGQPPFGGDPAAGRPPYGAGDPPGAQPPYGPGQPPYAAGQPPYGDPGAGQPPYGAGDPAAGQPPYGAGQPPYGDPGAGQPPYGAGQPPYGDPAGGRSPYGDPAGGQPPYGAGDPAAGQPPYGAGQPPYGAGQPPGWQPPYGDPAAGQPPYGSPAEQAFAAQQPPADQWTPPDPDSTPRDGPAAPPPGTRFLGAEEAQAGPPVPPAPPGGAKPPGTRVMSETLIGGFDFLEEAPQPARPVEEIAPPPAQAARRIVEKFGIRFVPGEQDVPAFLDEVRQRAQGQGTQGGGAEVTRLDSGPVAGAAPGVLLVGSPHTGQRRLARMIALTLANAGIGDGSLRTADADDVRARDQGGGDAAARVAELLRPGGPPLLFERMDAAISDALDPAAVVEAVTRARREAGGTPLIATCDPRSYKRLAEDHPALVELFQVYRLPDLTVLEKRMTLLHVLADERRVTLGGPALEIAEDDLDRLRGPGDLVNAKLVEAYLDTACQRHVSRAGASRDRLVLVPEDLSGVAESIEPALRPAGDVDGFLNRLDALLGLEDVKRTVEDLVAEARLAADRARYGVQAGNASRNLIFLGPAGVGKATVAGLLGGAYAALGLLDSGHVVACRPIHLTGRDRVDVENRVSSMVDQAMGGVLLIQESYRLDRSPDVVNELLRHMTERRDKFMIVCTGPAAEMEGFLAGNPGFRSDFGAIVEFAGLSDRELVQLFQGYAERDLYLLEEELRVELLGRFAQLRQQEGFAHARTARTLFEETVARQAARLSGADVNAATVARLTVNDLPESPLGQFLGGFRQDPGR